MTSQYQCGALINFKESSFIIVSSRTDAEQSDVDDLSKFLFSKQNVKVE